jgi:hypothetical protein
MLGGEAPLKQMLCRLFDLRDRPAANIGKQQRLVVDPLYRFLLGDLDQRRSSVFVEPTGPSAACGLMTISSAASAISVLPDIA